MKLSSVPFAQLRRFLTDLGFQASRKTLGWRFDHPQGVTAFYFRPYRPSEKVNNADLETVRTHLDWHGLLDLAAFDRLLNKTPA